MSRLEGKIAAVTGASSGFGRAIAMAFAAEGAKVVVSDLHEEPNAGGFESDGDATTVEAITATGGEAAYVTCDVTKLADVQALVREVVEIYGRLDIFVNNAGIYRGGKLAHEFTEEDLDACFAVNVKGTFFGAQEAVKQFLAQGDGGNIINLVSTAGLGGHPKQSVYNTSKGAAANLTRCLAIEYGHEQIRVNGICPTYAKTALTRARLTTRTSTTSSPSRSRSSAGAKSKTSRRSPSTSPPMSRATSTATSSVSTAAKRSRATPSEETTP
jgi:NAD(P)-dependent dehydrogenase (short-subunit alcohol dehydrogenase family)